MGNGDRGGSDDHAKRDDVADALSRVEHDPPSEVEPAPPASTSPPPPPIAPLPPPARAAEFRRPARPSAPPGARTPPGATAPTPSPEKPALASDTRTPPPAPAKPKSARPQRLDRPDRPEGPPSTAWSEDEAALVQSHYEPTSEIIDDDDAVVVPAPEPEVFAPPPPAPAPAKPQAIGNTRGLAWRRTVIPILLTCGVLLIGIGALRWVGGADSIFADMSIPLSATLCGCGLFLLLVAVLNMLQVKAELAAAAKPAR